MQELLESCGYNSVPFKSALDFLQCGERPVFGCILSDIKMPGMDGLQLQKALNREASRPPIIFMTSIYDARLRDAAMRGGAVAFLVKPVEAEQLVRCLEGASDSSNR